MAFQINTNVPSLQAQEYLRVSSEFQSKTINRVTSGLRIIQSGDDAAGLAIANGFRSDQAVLTQGIRNANDGLSTLQIIDGGINNISKLLDRARTLATQSATGTFTGSRAVLNSEFQSLISEIDRQAQSIGLNNGGLFAKSLQVFIGGGRASAGVSETTNGSVSVDLTTSTVDAKSLGLKGVAAVGTTATDIGNSSTTSVSLILADTTNTGSEAVGGFTDFYFSGGGFSDANKIRVSVNLAGVTDANTLVTAVNQAITAAGNGSSQYATAFKNAGVTAAINTDSQGRKQLTFSSSSAAFQAQAGDRVANALLGNFTSGTTGKDLVNTVAGTAATKATGQTLTEKTIVRIQGSGLASPVDIVVGAAGDDAQVALNSLSSQVANNAALQAAGITLNGGSSLVAGTSTLSFASKRGESFNVSTVGDINDVLRLGTYRNSAAAGAAFDYTSITAGAAFGAIATADAVTKTIEFSIAGGAAISITTAALAVGETATTAVDKLNTAILGNAALRSAGIVASASGGTNIKFDSSNGTAFRLNVTTDANNKLGFGAVLGAAGSAAISASPTDNTNNVHYDVGGAYATSAYRYSPILNGQDAQTLNFSTVDSSGATHTLAVVLQDNATARNARSLDEAISTINQKLQQTNDPTLQKIVAVKEYIDATHEGIKFVSTSKFNVGVGQAGTGGAVGVGQAADQGAVATASLQAGGSTADVSTEDTAKLAVTALATAVANLGVAQAVVGKGQNQFSFAVNLAQSQVSNLAAADSRIRDADLAMEAANLTKAQIVLQAGIAALAQANSAPQQVLALLRG